VSRYKCPFCEFHAMTLYTLKSHVQRMHPIADKCPACNKPVRTLYAHLYNMRFDPNHLLLYYFYIRKVPFEYREIAKKLLGEENEEVPVS
jgi:hypothetical protein